MDFVQEASSLFDGFATWWIGDGGKVTESWRKFAGVKKFSIEGGGGDMSLISEAAAAENAMEFKGVELGTGFDGRWCGIGWNWWEFGWVDM
jgi:hypothetical protein